MTKLEQEIKEAVDARCQYTYADMSAEDLFGAAAKAANKYFLEELMKYWTFDENQRHTHSWHDKQDFIEKILKS